MLMHSLFSETEEAGAAALAGDDEEIFFGPVGHMEKCVAVGVNEAAEATDKFRPMSPLTADQMTELFREAYTVAYQLERDGVSKLPPSKAEIPIASSNDDASSFNPVEHVVSGPNAANLLERPFSHSETFGASGGLDMLLSNEFEDLILNIPKASSGSCVDKELSSSIYNTGNVVLCSAESGGESSVEQLLTYKLSSSNPFLGPLSTLVPTSSLAESGSVLQDKPCSSQVGSVVPDVAETSGRTSGVEEVSSSDHVEDLISVVAKTSSRSCTDEVLSGSACTTIIACSSEIRGDSHQDSPSSSDSFEGLLSTLGSALPVAEPGSLNQDEHGVVKFSAVAVDSASAVKCRTSIPVPSGLRRAKASGTRSSGIPMNTLKVRHRSSFTLLVLLHLME